MKRERLKTNSMKGKIRKTTTGTVAVQATDGSRKFVGIGNLRVLLVPDGKFWFAQGLEIDYGAQGDDVAEARKNFEEGLYATIDLNLRMNGDIDSLLVFAPSEVLREASRKRKSIQLYAHVSMHNMKQQAQSAFPFTGIDYLMSESAA
jgi:hypothetical protein